MYRSNKLGVMLNKVLFCALIMSPTPPMRACEATAFLMLRNRNFNVVMFLNSVHKTNFIFRVNFMSFLNLLILGLKEKLSGFFFFFSLNFLYNRFRFSYFHFV